MSVDLAELLVTADQDAIPPRPSTYRCDGCDEQISAHKARIHCQTCEKFDLCANCFVIGVSAGSHAAHHPTSVIVKSGLKEAAQVPDSPPETPPAEPKSVELVHATNSGSQILRRERTASNAATPAIDISNSVDTSAPSRQPSVSIQRRAVGSARAAPPAPPPRLPPRPTPPAAASSSRPSSAWQPLFDGNLASPIFVDLLHDIFDLLDPHRTGHLTPEAYSSFLDTQGYALEYNIWKKSLNPVYGQDKEGVADAAFKEALDNLSIEHSVAPRQRAPPTNNMNNTFGRMSLYESVHQHITQATARQLSSGQMPLLTRKGFIDVTTLEVLADPSKGWGNLNRALRAYRLWQERGPIPRERLPAFPPQEILDHAKRVAEMAQYKAEVKLANLRAYSNLAKQGRDHAVELTRPDRDRYYYY